VQPPGGPQGMSQGPNAHNQNRSSEKALSSPGAGHFPADSGIDSGTTCPSTAGQHQGHNHGINASMTGTSSQGHEMVSVSASVAWEVMEHRLVAMEQRLQMMSKENSNLRTTVMSQQALGSDLKNTCDQLLSMMHGLDHRINGQAAPSADRGHQPPQRDMESEMRHGGASAFVPRLGESGNFGGANDLCRRRKGDNDSGAISAATTAHAQPCAEEAVSRSMPTVCVKKDVPIVDEVTDIKREAAEYVASTSANAIHMDQDNQRAFETIAHPSALDQQRSQAAFSNAEEDLIGEDLIEGLIVATSEEDF